MTLSRREMVGLRKDARAIEERIATAKQRSWNSQHEAIMELAVAEAMCEELTRRLHELTEGHTIVRPTRHEVRLLLEARRRVPRT